jgi:trehalose-6-phosphate synthase
VNRLVAVSNRVAGLNDPGQAGGLAVGLGDALKARRGIWFGWDGKTVGQGTHVAPHVQEFDRATTITLPMTKKDYREFYAGFANSVLWPLLHYRLDLVAFEPAFLRGYKRVNSEFANALFPHLKPKDTIWIHDYHLIPLAAELRRRGCTQRIGFFLHTPFPPPEIFAAAPESEWLIRSLFSYDLLGFQTTVDLANFRNYSERYQDAKSDRDGRITAFENAVIARCFPIGIDVEAFAAMARTPDAEQQIRTLRQRTLKRQQIIGVDRLDYSKGLPERMQAYRRLLEMHPENQKSVTFMQIAPPTFGHTHRVGNAVGFDKRALCGFRLDAPALHSSRNSAQCAGGPVPGQPGRLRQPRAGRYEPRCERVCRRSGRQGSRRSCSFEVRRRGGRPSGGVDRKPLRSGRYGRKPTTGVENVACRAPPPSKGALETGPCA